MFKLKLLRLAKEYELDFDNFISILQEDNTLYRIQLPYFWPSHAQQADNVEYG